MNKHSIVKVLKSPRIALARIVMSDFVGKHLSDVTYLRLSYRLKMGKKLDLEHPKTYTEKIQWLKLHNDSELCTKVVDKYAVRAYISETIGEEYLIPMLGVWNKYEEIDFDMLPDKFVLKCSHDSGSVIICKDKSHFDYRSAEKKLSSSLRHNFYLKGRELPYKNVPPRIIAEQFMVDDKSSDLADFKFFCFNGEPKILFYASDRFNAAHRPAYFDYYDMDLNRLDISSKGHLHNPKGLDYFPQFEEMKRLSGVLSHGFPHVRVDFYLINGKVYFGELTFHHDGGYVPFEPDKWDQILGDWIRLPIDEK